MSTHVLCCPCGEVILKSDNYETKIRSRVLLVKGATTYAVCKGCGEETSIPMSLDHSVVKSLPINPRLFIGRKPK